MQIYDTHVHHICWNWTEILFGSENLRFASEERIKGPICYFDVLADHFVHVPHSGKPILNLIVQLWSQSFACHIFSLLFHKWVCELTFNSKLDGFTISWPIIHHVYFYMPLNVVGTWWNILQLISLSSNIHQCWQILLFLQLFEVELDKSEFLLRYSSALVQGATDVFWYEL